MISQKLLLQTMLLWIAQELIIYYERTAWVFFFSKSCITHTKINFTAKVNARKFEKYIRKNWKLTMFWRYFTSSKINICHGKTEIFENIENVINTFSSSSGDGTERNNIKIINKNNRFLFNFHRSIHTSLIWVEVLWNLLYVTVRPFNFITFLFWTPTNNFTCRLAKFKFPPTYCEQLA